MEGISKEIIDELKKYEPRGYDWSIMQLIRLGLINDIDLNEINEIIDSRMTESEIYVIIMDKIEEKMGK